MTALVIYRNGVQSNSRAGGHLKETDLTAVLGIVAEEPADSFKPIDKAFGIIQAIHPDRQSALAQAVPQQAGIRSPGGFHRALGKSFRINTNRIDDRCNVVATPKKTAFVIRMHAQRFFDAVQERPTIRPRMEANNIIRAEAAQQLG